MTKELGFIYILPKYFIIQNKGIFKDPFHPNFRAIYEIKDAPHKQKIHIETEKNRAEYTYMWRKIEKNE